MTMYYYFKVMEESTLKRKLTSKEKDKGSIENGKKMAPDS